MPKQTRAHLCKLRLRAVNAGALRPRPVTPGGRHDCARLALFRLRRYGGSSTQAPEFGTAITTGRGLAGTDDGGRFDAGMPSALPIHWLCRLPTVFDFVESIWDNFAERPVASHLTLAQDAERDRSR